jgi:hypothetical protein
MTTWDRASPWTARSGGAIDFAITAGSGGRNADINPGVASDSSA